MATYQCPRCGRTEMYYAQRQQVVGSGYAQEVRWVNTALCKACGERMNVFLTEEDKGLVAQWYNKLSKRAKFLFVLASIGVSFGLLMLLMLFVDSALA